MSTSSSRIRTYLEDEIAERTTPPIQATFLNDSGVAQQPVSAALTLHYQGTIINSRDAVNLLGSITSGVLNFGTEAADFAMQQTVEESEVHVALIEWTWLDTAGRTRSDKHEILHTVRNFLQVP
jgi:hypothetical protein